MEYPLTTAVLCFAAAGLIARALFGRRRRESAEARHIRRYYMRGSR